MWNQWFNRPETKTLLQEILEYNGEGPPSNKTTAAYTEKTDDQLTNSLLKPIKVISTNPITTQPNTVCATSYSPPLTDSTNDSTDTKTSTSESPFSPFYRLWGHT